MAVQVMYGFAGLSVTEMWGGGAADAAAVSAVDALNDALCSSACILFFMFYTIVYLVLRMPIISWSK
jgi:hypothetical protein